MCPLPRALYWCRPFGRRDFTTYWFGLRVQFVLGVLCVCVGATATFAASMPNSVMLGSSPPLLAAAVLSVLQLCNLMRSAVQESTCPVWFPLLPLLVVVPSFRSSRCAPLTMFVSLSFLALLGAQLHAWRRNCHAWSVCSTLCNFPKKACFVVGVRPTHMLLTPTGPSAGMLRSTMWCCATTTPRVPPR